jgi:hypothetical protein
MGPGTAMIAAGVAAAVGADNIGQHKPFSSAVERPLESLVSSLHIFPEDHRQPATHISTTAYASSLTAVIVILLMVAGLYVDYRRHAFMYAFPHNPDLLVFLSRFDQCVRSLICEWAGPQDHPQCRS